MNTFFVVAAVLVGWFASGLLLAMLIGPQMRRSAAGLASDLGSAPPRRQARPAVVKPAVGAWRRHGRLTVSAGFAAVAFAGSTGLAAAGALPQPVQGVAHSVLRSVGVSVPEVSGNGPADDPSPVAMGADDDAPSTDDLRPARNPAVAPAATERRAERDRVEKSSTTVTSAAGADEAADEPTEPATVGVASVPTTAPGKQSSTTTSSTVPATPPTTAGPTGPIFAPPPPSVPPTSVPPSPPPTEEPPVEPVPEPPPGGFVPRDPGVGSGSLGDVADDG